VAGTAENEMRSFINRNGFAPLLHLAMLHGWTWILDATLLLLLLDHGKQLSTWLHP